MIETLTNEFSKSYTDASPSELIHNSQENFLCIGLVSFFFIKRENLIPIPQFKKVRGIERKLKTQKYIIDNITSKNIAPIGIVRWNYKEIALKNGELILAKSNICNRKNYEEIITINGENLSYGHAVSLAWYSVVIATFFKEIGVITKIMEKKKASLLIDLLAGDNSNNFRNLKVVEYIIDNSELLEFQFQAIEINQLELLGYGYGIKDGDTKNLKNDFEYSLTDWIIQSFHSLLKYERLNLDKTSQEFQLSELAIMLVKSEAFKITSAIEIIG